MVLNLKSKIEKGIIVVENKIIFETFSKFFVLPTDQGESSKCNSLHAIAVRIRERYHEWTHVCMYVYSTHTRIDESMCTNTKKYDMYIYI